MAPGMKKWLDRVFWVLGGYITATGSLTSTSPLQSFRTRARGARVWRSPWRELSRSARWLW